MLGANQDLLSYNLYAYTSSNPVNMVDPDGEIGIIIGCLIIGGVAGYMATALINPKTTDLAQQGYNSFGELKKNICEPAPGNQIHHIVEQSQIAKSGFSPQVIHNINNITEISKSLHQKISGYYSSKPIDLQTGGLKVRDWLAGQDFKTQRDFGIKVIEMFKR